MMFWTLLTLILLQGFIFNQDQEAAARNIHKSFFYGKVVRNICVVYSVLLFEDIIIYSYLPKRDGG